jgi:hypothetical protein
MGPRALPGRERGAGPGERHALAFGISWLVKGETILKDEKKHAEQETSN